MLERAYRLFSGNCQCCTTLYNNVDWYHISIMTNVNSVRFYCNTLIWGGFQFPTIPSCLLLKLMELIFNMSIWLSLVAFSSMSWTVPLLSLLLLHTTHFKAVYFPADPTHPPIFWTLSMWVAITTVLVYVLCLCWWFEKCFTFGPTLPNFIMSKSFFSLKLSHITVCVLWALTLLVHARTCSLVTTFVSLMAVSLCIISVSMLF